MHVLQSITFLAYQLPAVSSGGWIVVLELYPGFSLYRGLYEFAAYAFEANATGNDGMRWSNLNDSVNGMRTVLIIMFIEWILVLLVAYYLDQVLGSRKSPLFFLKRFQKKPLSSSFRKASMQRQGSKVFVQMEKPDVIQEVFMLISNTCTLYCWYNTCTIIVYMPLLISEIDDTFLPDLLVIMGHYSLMTWDRSVNLTCIMCGFLILLSRGKRLRSCYLNQLWIMQLYVTT